MIGAKKEIRPRPRAAFREIDNTRSESSLVATKMEERGGGGKGWEERED